MTTWFDPPRADPLQNESLPDGQGRAAISETDLDHGPGVVVDQEVAQDVTVLIGQRDPGEVAVRPGELGSHLGQSPACGTDGMQARRSIRHSRSLAERAAPPQGGRRSG